MKSSKKRVLSSEQYETGDEPKKQTEGRWNESSTSTSDDILANWFHRLEQQEKETFDLDKKSSESQIKGELAI